jgi:hypothetical protein
MLRLKTTCATLVAISAAGVVPAVASSHAFRVAGTEIPAGTTYVTSGLSSVSKLKTTILGFAVTIECEEDTNSGGITEGGKSNFTILGVNCKVVGAANCAVPNKEFVLEVAGLLVHEPVQEEWTASAGGNIGKVKINGAACAIKGMYNIRGIQICNLPSANTEKLFHAIECLPAGSTLKVGTEIATFEGTETIGLNSGQAWSAI